MIANVMEPQSASAVLMVRPARFAFNPETAASNAFQSASIAGLEPALLGADVQTAAEREFDRLAEQIGRAGVDVLVADDTPLPVKPDAVFPNNWVSFHHDGTVVLYPMQAPNRRNERRDDVLRQVLGPGGFQASRTVDLTPHEREARYLEGTGSLVLDRTHRLAYAALSPRTSPQVLGEFGVELDYELITFDAADATGTAIYHTNVLMAVGNGFAVVCSEVIGAAQQRRAVLEKLEATGHRLIDITAAQLRHFAGNLLELASALGGPVIALSSTAWAAFSARQRRQLEAQGALCVAQIPVIERVGGGGVRCMLAEIHLPRVRAARLM